MVSTSFFLSEKLEELNMFAWVQLSGEWALT